MIENLMTQKKCSVCGCNNIARFKLNAACKNRHEICLCAGCLNELYREIGQKVIPKGIGNFLSEKNLEKNTQLN